MGRSYLLLRQVRNVENALRVGTLFRNSPYPIGPIFRPCGVKSMSVLGTLNYPEIPTAFNPLLLSVYMSQGFTVPQVFCPTTTNIAIQITMFDQPDPERMQYISLQPMNLALGSKQRQSENPSSHFAEIDVEEEEERMRLGALVEKLKLHSVVRHSPTQKEMALGAIINQINCCLELANLLQRNSPFIGPRRK